ncbi:MAG: hypothetical protein OEL89_05425, partial [Candidatus Peregrinibacteria bacterium]|nr:hypothetical protein [Candidatus Peregrinibacteria bacterium]
GITDSAEFTGENIVTLPKGAFPENPNPKAAEDMIPEIPKSVAELPKEETHSSAEVLDVRPPVDAQNLKYDSSRMQEGVIVLTWEKSLDFDGDVLDQVLYTKKGTGQFDAGYSIGKDVETLDFAVEENQNYEVRIETIDRNENRSIGTTLTFSTSLAKSGPESVIAIAIALMIGWGFLFRKKEVY